MPTDDVATILAQVREWELQEHNEAEKYLHQARTGRNTTERHKALQVAYYSHRDKEEAYKRVAVYIESNPVQLHRRLVE